MADAGSPEAMIPVGYMAKRIAARPEWLTAEQVADIYSVSCCVSRDVLYDGLPLQRDAEDWRSFTAYWLFHSPELIQERAQAHSIDLAGAALFFYEVHELEYDDETSSWTPFKPSPPTVRVAPSAKTLEGYDVVSCELGTRPQCSPLSCNKLATEVETNEHCLLPSFDRARQLLSDGRFDGLEPGPFRIFAVHSVAWP